MKFEGVIPADSTVLSVKTTINKVEVNLRSCDEASYSLTFRDCLGFIDLGLEGSELEGVLSSELCHFPGVFDQVSQHMEEGRTYKYFQFISSWSDECLAEFLAVDINIRGHSECKE